VGTTNISKKDGSVTGKTGIGRRISDTGKTNINKGSERKEGIDINKRSGLTVGTTNISKKDGLVTGKTNAKKRIDCASGTVNLVTRNEDIKKEFI